jgi:hypothetical protein
MTVFEWAVKHDIGQTALSELMLVLDPPRGERTTMTTENTEEAVQANLQLEGARRGVSLWRNNSGALKDDRGRLVRYGLANTSSRINDVFKSSDLIGIWPVRITSTHVGRTFGIFTAVEVKEPGWKNPRNDRERAQGAFHQCVRGLGGFATFAQATGDVFQQGEPK